MKKFVLGLLLGLFAFGLFAGGNLLPNGDFAQVSVLGGMPFGWRFDGEPQVEVSARDGAVKMANVPSAAKHWNMLVESVPGVKPNTPYVLSALVRTKGVKDGSMAYLSLNCYSKGNRTHTGDSPMHLSGDKDWTRLVVKLPCIPRGADETKVHLCLYGQGEAEFKEVQVTEGNEVQPFAPYRGTDESFVRYQAQEKAAEAWLAKLGSAQDGKRIAVLDMGLPAGKNGNGFVSSPDTIVKSLSRIGEAVKLNGSEVCNPFILNAKTFDLLVVPCGDFYPAEGKEALSLFLRSGGNLITMGGYAFDTPVYRQDDKWAPMKSLSREGLKGTTPMATGEKTTWRVAANEGCAVEIGSAAGPNGAKGIAVRTPFLSGWATACHGVPADLPKGWSVISFWAKGDAKTPEMWLEFGEKDGSRWHYPVELTNDWREVTLTADQFTYWVDNTSVGRGFVGDHFKPENVAYIQFGVAVDLAQPHAAHEASLADVRVGIDPKRALREKTVPRINARYGTIRDQLTPEPDQIRAFDASFPLRDGAKAELANEVRDFFPAFSVKGKLGGYSAVGPLGLNGHGFGPGVTRWVPLLTCEDSNGAPCGHAGAFLRHYAGAFAGSSWAIFGVNESDLFGPGAEKLLPAVAEELMRRCFLAETEAEYCSYERGQQVKLRGNVVNAAKAARQAEVRLALRDEKGRELAKWTQTLEAKSGASVPFERLWTVPQNAPDVVYIRSELWLDGVKRDAEENAFCVWTPEIVENGPKVALNGTLFSFDGKTRFGMGCQTWWGQINTTSARSVLRFIQDFRQMHEAGLVWTRQFLGVGTEAGRRFSDAMVQLTQKYGIVLYHAPNLSCVADEAALAEEEKQMAWIAERYKNVKGICIDICNEPVTRYDEAFDKAFGKKAKPIGSEDDADCCATWAKMADIERSWARRNRAAGQAKKSDLNMAVGWSQGWGGGKSGKDVTYASLDLDFTDRHYYGALQAFGPEIKDLDLRVLGKPYLVGECGAKCHPTFVECDPWHMGETEAQYSLRFKYLAYHAFGLGAGSLLCWHWRDPMEGCFPCGLVNSTGVPREALATFRGCAKAFGELELAQNPPEVVLIQPTRLMNSGVRGQIIERMRAIQRCLQSYGVNYSALPEVWLENHAVPESVKLVIRPAAYAVGGGVKKAFDAFTQRGGKVWQQPDMAASEARGGYASILKEANVFTAWREGDPEDIEIFYVPARKTYLFGLWKTSAHYWVFWNNANADATVVRDGKHVTVKAHDGAYLVQ